MKFLMKLFDPRGLKPWILGLALVSNLVLTGIFFTLINGILIQKGGVFEGLDTTLMLGVYLITGLIGFGIALLAHDHRGPTYAIWGSIVSFVVITIIMVQSGILAVIVGAMALLGGYNGGMIGEQINLRRGR